MPSNERRIPQPGDAIEVFWPDDNAWYGGTLGLYFRPTRRYAVNYDDEDREVLDLHKERWRFKGDLDHQPKLTYYHPSEPFSVNGQTESSRPAVPLTPPTALPSTPTASPPLPVKEPAVVQRKSPSRAQKKSAPTKNRTRADTPPVINPSKSRRDAAAADAVAAKGIRRIIPDVPHSREINPVVGPPREKNGIQPRRAQPRAPSANRPSWNANAAFPGLARALPWQNQPLPSSSGEPSPLKSVMSGYVSEETLSAGGPSPGTSPPRKVPLRLKLGVTKKRRRPGPGPSATEVSAAEALASLEVQMRRTDELNEIELQRKPVVKENAEERINSIFEQETEKAEKQYERVSSVLDSVKVRAMMPNHDLLSVLRDARSQIINTFQRARMRR